MFVDASALVAIIGEEPEEAELTAALDAADVRLTSGLAMWEAARALGKASPGGAQAGLLEVERYCTALAIGVVPIGSAEAAAAVEAHSRYGEGRHPARLTTGDCFAYACARTNNARLLYKGDDFARTDLADPA